MTVILIVLIAVVVFAAGALIGSVSIGGIIIVPALTLITGFGIQVVVSATVFSFLFSGLMGAYIYTNRGLVNWKFALWIGLGAMLGGYLGSILLTSLPEILVELIVGIILLVSGLYALLMKQKELDENVSLPSWSLCLIGFGVGVGSAVSGAGGPVLLLPVLLWLNVPMLAAIAQGQIVQIPVALFATARNIQAENFDVQLGLLISVFVVAGAWFGARISSHLPVRTLRNIVASVLVFSSIMVLGKVALNLY